MKVKQDQVGVALTKFGLEFERPPEPAFPFSRSIQNRVGGTDAVRQDGVLRVELHCSALPYEGLVKPSEESQVGAKVEDGDRVTRIDLDGLFVGLDRLSILRRGEIRETSRFVSLAEVGVQSDCLRAHLEARLEPG